MNAAIATAAPPTTGAAVSGPAIAAAARPPTTGASVTAAIAASANAQRGRAQVAMPTSGASRTPARHPLRGRRRPASTSPGTWGPGGGRPAERWRGLMPEHRVEAFSHLCCRLVWHAADRCPGITVTTVLTFFGNVPSGGADWSP